MPCVANKGDTVDPCGFINNIHDRISSVVGIKAVTTNYSRIALAEQEIRLAVRAQPLKTQEQQHQNLHGISHTQIQPERHSLPTTLVPV